MNKVKIPSGYIPLAYLNYNSQFNEEIREYFLSLFDESDQIIFSEGVFCVNSKTEKKTKKNFQPMLEIFTDLKATDIFILTNIL